MRKSGILLHISALPNKYGIGTFGKEAYEFVDFLNDAGQSYWQVLPLGPTTFGDSPYQSFSAFAGNPYFIDFDLLKEEKLLKKSDYDYLKNQNDRVDFEWLYINKYKVLRKAFNNFFTNNDYLCFLKENSYWLDDYALFMAIKENQNNNDWIKWETDFKKREVKAIKEFIINNQKEIDFWKFVQYVFFKQWFNLKNYANKKGIKIIGDVPIYVAYDSSDVWANPYNWQLNENYQPIKVAGCPPDAFSALGQLWGNPIYDYKKMKKDNYNWWIERVKKAFEMFDTVRIDHFRGFSAYYAIPYGDKDACNGHWEEGPGIDLFNKIKEKLGNVEIIAEDLGFLTEDVHKLLRETGYPGMKILEFAFNPYDDSLYLPHNLVKNAVIYPGTHDNPPIKEWLDTVSKEEKEYCYKYLGIKNEKEAIDKLIASCLASVCNLAIVQLVDYLHLGSEARFNTPSTISKNNWSYRLDKKLINKKLSTKIYTMNKIYKRI